MVLIRFPLSCLSTDWRSLFGLAHGIDHRVVEHIKHGLPHALANLDQQGGRERRFPLIAGQTDEVLEIGVFLNLCNRFPIGKAQLVFDDHRPDDQSSVFGGAALGTRQIAVVGLGQLIPGDALAHFDPAVVFIQCRLGGPVKLR